MRKISHGVVWFEPAIEARVLELMKLQSSATRSAYQAMHKHGLKGNDVKVYVKKNYYPELSQRHVSDACSMASGVSQDNALFGGKKSWLEFVSGNKTKDDWQADRNSTLFSMGDATKKGNPNIRVVDDKLLVNDPSKRGKWLEGKLFLPKKFQCLDLTCYDVRVIHRGDKFEVKIGWDAASPPKLPTIGGAVGVDCNPDGVSVVEADVSGNLVKHVYEREQRIQFASKNKRDSDIRLLAKRVVATAKAAQKPLVVEELKFSNKKKGTKKFKRMKSNYLHAKIIDSIKTKAEKEGVEVIAVNPAFTSVLGELKFKKMYSLNRHTAAGLVIARRGMGIQERQTFEVRDNPKKVRTWKLEARHAQTILTEKSLSYLQSTWLRMKSIRPHRSDAGPYCGIGVSVGETPTGEVAITGRHRDMEEIPMS
jgi:IS605 OrfB family transposase